MGGYSVVTLDEKSHLVGEAKKLVRAVWPWFLAHDSICEANWERLYDLFLGYQSALLDTSTGRIVAVTNSVPLPEESDPERLPAEGWDWALDAAVRKPPKAGETKMLCALAASISAEYQGLNLGERLIRDLKSTARRQGARSLVIPARPTRKSQHPWVEFQTYLSWRRSDGLPYDPWLRSHVREGARVAQMCDRSMLVTGTVAEWEQWTGVGFPRSGSYVVPGSIVPIHIDRSADRGRYVEPNVWIVYRTVE